ncbi:MAG: DUF211 domain-containing protein [Candidatus Lokiarchaeota archaeon]|uniref:ACT domain-containing protein n=1 Tax=marine sediment metagenome TaxID=412755 RepID=X1D837_9ZZZZ|nr:DUF211 domain-containing protein [Candidatus Lokiarchaeota archaeon]
MKVGYYLDILKPHQPGVDLVARTLMKINGVTKVRIKVDELDQRTASLHINIEGNDLSFEEITDVLDSINCALHSVDQVDLEKED